MECGLSSTHSNHSRRQGKSALPALCTNFNEMEQYASVRYGSVAQALHWVTAVPRPDRVHLRPWGIRAARVYSPARDFDRQLHETLGLCVFALVVMRVFWRTVDTRPGYPQSPRWMVVAAKAMHGALYALLFALPITAIAGRGSRAIL
jgi:cytochrome b561